MVPRSVTDVDRHSGHVGFTSSVINCIPIRCTFAANSLTEVTFGRFGTLPVDYRRRRLCGPRMTTSITDVISDTVEDWSDGERSHPFGTLA